MTEEHSRRRRSNLGAGIVVVLVVLLLSQISIGPVAWMASRGWISSGVGETLESTVYVPLVVLHDHSEVCGHAIEKYVSFWEGPSAPVPPASYQVPPNAVPSPYPPAQSGR